MMKFTTLFISVVGLAGAGLGGCIASDPEPVFVDDEGIELANVEIDSASNMFAGPAPSAFIDERGERHVLVGKAMTSDVPMDALGRPQMRVDHESTADKRPRSLEELADDLRGVTLMGGYEYRQEQPALELARMALDSRSRAAPVTTPSSPMIESHKPTRDEHAGSSDESLASDKAIIGTDNRTVKTNNTGYPWRAIVHSDAGCTGTLISATTIVTAAHCVYDTLFNTWIIPGGVFPKYGRGADAGDVTTYPYGQFSCYAVTVPQAWVDSFGPDTEYDYAVIELLCSESSSDWLGTWTAAESTIESSTTYLYGYPSDKSPYPQIWGTGVTAGGTYVDDDDDYLLRYYIDTANGQSGSAVYLYNSSNERRVVGIHSAYDPIDETNMGRRWDVTVYNFVAANSNFPNDT